MFFLWNTLVLRTKCFCFAKPMMYVVIIDFFYEFFGLKDLMASCFRSFFVSVHQCSDFNLYFCILFSVQVLSDDSNVTR